MKQQSIIQYTKEGKFIKVWDSIADVVKQLGLKTHANVISCCGRKPSVNTAHGFIWRYYEDNYPATIEPAKKMGQLFKELHGVDSPGHSKLLETRRDTSTKKYGVSHPMKNDEVKLNYRESVMRTYGVDNPAKLDSVKLKISNTESSHKTSKLLERYPNLHFIKFTPEGLMEFRGDCNHSFLINRQLLVVRGNKNHVICTECNKPDFNQKSEIEIYLADKMEELGCKIERGVKGLAGTKHELDIYMPDYSIGIEVNGIKYHNDAYRDRMYHLNKTELFASVGIRIIHLFDDEISDKSDIILSMMSNIVGRSKKINARSCVIKEITSSDAAEFLRVNHIQGKTSSTVRFGLFFEDELVSVMTFSPTRNVLGREGKTENEWELVRYCNKLSTSVVGGASKLFSHFIKNMNPQTVYTYANRRWSSGNMYYKLGFTFDGNTDPGYWYFFKNKRVHRYTLRKDVLVAMGCDPSKSEADLTEEMNIPRIYDCGNIRFIWKTKTKTNEEN